MDTGLDKRRGRTVSTMRGAGVEVVTFTGVFDGRRGIRSSDCRSDPLQQRTCSKTFGHNTQLSGRASGPEVSPRWVRQTIGFGSSCGPGQKQNKDSSNSTRLMRNNT